MSKAMAIHQTSQMVRSRICSPSIVDEQICPNDKDAMSCYVSLPDAAVIEVCLPRDAKGIDCLTDVCKRLDIVELDYFGLRYEGPKGELLWLNLRNPIPQQLRQSRWKTKRHSYRCYRLQFLVKFFVPVHAVLQDTTRTQFYLNLRTAFLDGDYVRYAHNALKQTDLVTLYALIAQAELGDCDSENAQEIEEQYLTQLRFRPQLNMLVGKSDDSVKPAVTEVSSTKESEIIVAREPQERDTTMEAILEAHRALKGCKQQTAVYKFLEIFGKLDDYGYEFHVVENSRYESLVVGVGPDAIKFCKLSTSLQGTSCTCPSRSVSCEGNPSCARRDSEPECACKAYDQRAFSVLRLATTTGGRRKLFRRTARGTQLESDVDSEPEGICTRVKARKSSESSESQSRCGSETESHSACKQQKLAQGANNRWEKAASREVSVQRMVGDCVERYPYAVVSRARMDDRVLFLTVANESGVEHEFGSRCASSKAAVALYRAITERHTFYRCDSIRDDVASQTKRAFRGPLASWLSDVKGSGAHDFIFDVTRTSRESLDYSRRVLYRRERSLVWKKTTAVSVDSEGENEVFEAAETLAEQKKEAEKAQLEELQRLREQVRLLKEDRLCKVCADAPKQVAFDPCGHFCVCQKCAAAVHKCPFCRTPIAKSMRIFEATSS